MKSFITWLKEHHIIHTWSKWERVETESTMLLKYKVEGIGQIRHCTVCNKTQIESL